MTCQPWDTSTAIDAEGNFTLWCDKCGVTLYQAPHWFKTKSKVLNELSSQHCAHATNVHKHVLPRRWRLNARGRVFSCSICHGLFVLQRYGAGDCDIWSWEELPVTSGRK